MSPRVGTGVSTKEAPVPALPLPSCVLLAVWLLQARSLHLQKGKADPYTQLLKLACGVGERMYPECVAGEKHPTDTQQVSAQ